MLYRHKQGTFEVCPYKAVYTVVVNKVVEDVLIEIDGELVPQYKTIVVEEVRECYVSDKEWFELTLANSSEKWRDLNYEEVSLTEEQLERYNQIRSLPESAIGSCIEYVLNGNFPEGIEHALRHIQLAKDNEQLNESVILLENENLKLSLGMAQSSAETVQLMALLNEQQKLEQAKANAEIIQLLFSMTGGTN